MNFVGKADADRRHISRCASLNDPNVRARAQIMLRIVEYTCKKFEDPLEFQVKIIPNSEVLKGSYYVDIMTLLWLRQYWNFVAVLYELDNTSYYRIQNFEFYK